MQVVQSLIKLGIVVSTSDLLPVRRSIAYFLDNFERQTREQETIGVRLRIQCFISCPSCAPETECSKTTCSAGGCRRTRKHLYLPMGMRIQ